MADEPRRSVRSTKGQHKALDEPSASTPKPKKGKSKASKKAAEPSDDEDADVIRCVCGDNKDDVEGRYTACDACSVWQHNVCMAIPDPEPEHYFCEQCRPEEHQELLAAMKRGEKIWEDRIRAAEEAERATTKKTGKKGAKKGGRQSRVSDVKRTTPGEAVSSSPAPAATSQESNNKRKFEGEPVQASPSANGEKQVSPASVADGTHDRRSSERADKRRKSSGTAAKAAQKPDVETALVEIEQLPSERQKVANALVKVVADGIRGRVKEGQYRIPDGHTADTVGRHHASRIEYEMFMNHGAPSHSQAYAQQFRTIHANLKKNLALIDRLLSGSLTASELSTMSSQDMASEELQKERAAMKEEADKQAVMVQEEEKPRVRRTHKGDEVVEDSENQGGVESVFTSQPVRHRESVADAEMGGTAGSPAAEHRPAEKAGSPLTIDTKQESGSDRRTSSQQFDINAVWAKTAHSPDTERAPPVYGQNLRRNLTQSSKVEDADVDRLLRDDQDEPYSPADATSGDPGVPWRGPLIQGGVAELTVTARHVAGNDFSQYIQWSDFMPEKLEVEGRLDKDRADQYLCGLQWSKNSDVTVLALTPYDNKPAFDAIFDYFSTRKRYAVCKKAFGISPIVKDLYIAPVDGPLPPHLSLLDHNILDEPVKERILLATFVVNRPQDWDNPPPTPPSPLNHNQTPAGAPQYNHNIPPHMARQPSLGGVGSPIGGPAFSPRAQQGFTPTDSNPNPYGLPPNPYTPQQPHLAQQQQPGPHPFPSLGRQNPAWAEAERILGPNAAAPVVAQILAHTPGTVDAQLSQVLENLKDIFEKDPRAKEDFGVLQTLLPKMG